MQLIQNRRGAATVAVAATAALCSLGAILQSQADQQAEPGAQPQPEAAKPEQAPQVKSPGADVARPFVKRSPSDIPFDPPVVYPDNSYVPERSEESRRDLALRLPNRDLMFREEDRKTFQAMHPLFRKRYPVVEIERPKPMMRAEVVGRYTLLGHIGDTAISDNNVLQTVRLYERAAPSQRSASQDLALQAKGYTNIDPFVPLVRPIGYAQSARHIVTKERNEWVLKNAVIRSYAADGKVSETRHAEYIFKAK